MIFLSPFVDHSYSLIKQRFRGRGLSKVSLRSVQVRLNALMRKELNKGRARPRAGATGKTVYNAPYVN
jgi:hypothetical protein